ncbi:predicted protein [Uncinocarpus reesii 1704]|uniref:Uncharacterized protein n=1 Tax=Uncinocarpus reesii (strain UAMH 1704) TaxID=336963 RepID=C4JSW0_UNCRE|nr:uncharacterized protein UREG_05549 [Uncinocarpus reesii 1704]EEP80707.1 predicted protein [Uncinocarpus reesii 1704]
MNSLRDDANASANADALRFLVHQEAQERTGSQSQEIAVTSKNSWEKRAGRPSRLANPRPASKFECSEEIFHWWKDPFSPSFMPLREGRSPFDLPEAKYPYCCGNLDENLLPHVRCEGQSWTSRLGSWNRVVGQSGESAGADGGGGVCCVCLPRWPARTERIGPTKEGAKSHCQQQETQCSSCEAELRALEVCEVFSLNFEAFRKPSLSGRSAP